MLFLLMRKRVTNRSKVFSYRQRRHVCRRQERQCSELARANGMTDMYVQTLGDLSDFYAGKDPAKSNYYKKLHTEISDSIMQSGGNLREFYRLRNIQYLYELEKTDRRISELRMEQDMKDREIMMQRRAMTILAVALVVFLILLWIVLRQKKQIRTAYRNLFEINRNTISDYSATREQCERYVKRIDELESAVDSGKNAAETDEVEAPCAESDTFDDIIPESRSSSSSLDEEKKAAIWQKIEQKMEKEKIFCDSAFSLSRLAEAVDSNQAYVSRVVNDVYGKSFTDFVNDYRVREACVRLLDTGRYGNYTISAIAADVG